MYRSVTALLLAAGCALALGHAYAAPPPSHPGPPVTTPPVAAPPAAAPPTIGQPASTPPFQTPPVTTGQSASQNLPAAAGGAGDQNSHASATSQIVASCISGGQTGPALAACIVGGLGMSSTAQAVLSCISDGNTGADLAGCIVGVADGGQAAVAQNVLQCVTQFQDADTLDAQSAAALQSCIASAVGG